MIGDDGEILYSSENKEHTFQNTGNGEAKCISIDKMNEKVLNWKNDILTIQCHITNNSTMMNYTTYRSETHTLIGVNRYFFLWNLELTDLLKSEDRTIFLSKNSEFKFILNVQNDEIQIRIQKLEAETSNYKHVFCKISLRNLKGIELKLKVAKHLFLKDDSKSWDFPTFFSKKHLRNRENDLIQNNTFTLKFKVAVSTGEMLSEIKEMKYDAYPFLNMKSSDDSFSALQDNLLNMLKTEKNSDIKLCVDGLIIPVHKCILSARSHVFSAMFNQNMLENQTGVVDISDMEIEITNSLLEFIYTGFVSDITVSSAVKLLIAADKYEIPSLIEKCFIYLKSQLSQGNVCDVYAVADLVGHESLKLSAMEFIKMNSTEVLSSDTWSAFIEANIKLANEMLFKLALDFSP